MNYALPLPPGRTARHWQRHELPDGYELRGHGRRLVRVLCHPEGWRVINAGVTSPVLTEAEADRLAARIARLP